MRPDQRINVQASIGCWEDSATSGNLVFWTPATSERRAGAHLLRQIIPLIMKYMANRLCKLVPLWLLTCPPVWAERLPVPPIPPTGASPTRAVQAPHRASHSSTNAVSSRRRPVPPVPHAGTRLATPAPLPDRDARPPPDPDSSPHTKVNVTDFRQPNIDADAGYPYGSRFRTPEDAKPIQTPGFTLTIPLRLP